MSLRVFHAPDAGIVPGASLVLDAEESRYLLRVRRARVGESLEILDAAGGRWHGTLAAREGTGRAVVAVASPIPAPAPHREVTLLIGVPEPGALLAALAAACAGGATSVVLVSSRRGQVALPGRDRIDRLLRATMRQCGRPDAPALDGPLELEHALARAPEVPGLIARPGGHDRALPTGACARVLVGPEGGFSPEEDEHIDAAGFVPLALGPWTLRTEVAVTAALSRVITA